MAVNSASPRSNVELEQAYLAELNRPEEEELFAEIERDWYENEEKPEGKENEEADGWDDLFGEELTNEETTKKNHFSNHLIGVTTQTGIKVSDISDHMVERAVQRETSAEEIARALTVPVAKGKIREDRSQQFIGENVTVVINVDTGKIITAWPTSEKKRNKLKERKQD